MDALSRRSFVISVGLAGPAALVLAACGGDDGQTTTSDDFVDGTVPPGSLSVDGSLPLEYSVVQRWFPTWLVPGTVRLPASLSDVDGLLSAGPELLQGRILDVTDSSVVADGLTGRRHVVTEGAVPYWVFEAEIPKPGLYALQVEGADASGAALQVLDPATVTISKPGEPLKPFVTPTLDEPDGVDPICTLLPEPCPFHTVTLSDALKAGKPVAFLVGTPAHCQTGTCSPALEGLVSLKDEYGDRVTMIHAEIFTDDTATVTTPLVQFYGMEYEPSLFVTDASGTVVTRLDAAFDASEIRAALDLVV